MKGKTYLFAIPPCCMRPFMVQGADLEERNLPEDLLKAPLRSVPMSPVMVETQPGMLTLHFISDLSEVSVIKQKNVITP